ncbi:MAG: hypothetical protein OHK0021_24940 [Bryobacter sp.]
MNGSPSPQTPQLRDFVQRILDQYPAVEPNRTDIDPRMLNTNSPQFIDNESLSAWTIRASSSAMPFSPKK